MKKYIDAQLQVVRITKNDIVTTSLTVSNTDYSDTVYAPDRDFDEY